MPRMRPPAAALLLLCFPSFCFPQSTAPPAAARSSSAQAANDKDKDKGKDKDAKHKPPAPQVPACTGEKKNLQALDPSDAEALAKALDGMFPSLKISAITQGTGEDKKPTGELCITASEKNTQVQKCDPSTAPKKGFIQDCGLDEAIAALDIENFKGNKSISSNLLHIHHLSTSTLLQYFSQPSSSLDLHSVEGQADTLVLVPTLDGKATSDASAVAAAFKHDIELLDTLIGSASPSELQNAQKMADLVGNADPFVVGTENRSFFLAEKESEAWLARHTVRLSYLDPRDVSLAFGDMQDWTIQPRLYSRAVTILPKAPSDLREKAAFLSADAIERDALYREGQRESLLAPPKDAKPAKSDSDSAPPATTVHSTTTTQSVPPGKSPATSGTTIISTTTTTTQASAASADKATTAPTSSKDAAPASDDKPPSKTDTSSAKGGKAPDAGASKDKKSSADASPSVFTRQPLPLDNVVRLYHFRQAKDLATVLNGIGSRPLVQALTDKGNDDMLLILPSPPGEPDHSMDIRRAIAVLDLPRPQLSLQLWSYQISKELKKDRPNTKQQAGAQLQESFEGMRDVVNEINTKMTQRLQLGLGELMKMASENRNTFFDHDFETYLTHNYNDCIRNQNAYCLGYYDALSLFKDTQNSPNSRDASLTKLLLFLIATSDSQNPVDKIIAAMQPEETCPQDVHALKDGEKAPLCFENFKKQLGTLRQPHNLRLFRAALLDFLFQYKWTVVYPNDFVPYDLERTTNYLDGLFNPIVDAFNVDLDEYIQHELNRIAQTKNADKHLGLISRGMVQVADLSGTQANVDGKVNNYFDITPPLTLNDLLNVGNQPNVASTLKGILQPKEILIAQAFANITSQPRITAEISKEAKLTFTPIALDTASSAELEVDFDVSEPTAPQTVNQKDSQKDTLDRVAEHHVQSHVRVESLKLFQLSSFSMELTHPERGTPIPVIGNAWEAIWGNTPYISNLLRLPPYSRTVDNRSMVIVRAVVAPTAMDLGLSLRFESDRVIDKVGGTQDPLNSINQAGGRIRPFHRALMQCIVNGPGEGHQTCLDPAGMIKLSSMDEDLRTTTTQ